MPDLTYELTQSGTEVQDTLDQVTVNESAIGTLSNLTTTEKGSLVGAINEVNGKTITGIVLSDSGTNKTLTITLTGTTLDITYA